MKWHEKLLEYINWCYICMKHGECYYKEGEFEEGILFGRIKQKELWEDKNMEEKHDEEDFKIKVVEGEGYNPNFK